MISRTRIRGQKGHRVSKVYWEVKSKGDVGGRKVDADLAHERPEPSTSLGLYLVGGKESNLGDNRPQV